MMKQWLFLLPQMWKNRRRRLGKMKHPLYTSNLNLGNCFTMTEQNLLYKKKSGLHPSCCRLNSNFSFMPILSDLHLLSRFSWITFFKKKNGALQVFEKKIGAFLDITQNSGSNSKIISEELKVICISIPQNRMTSGLDLSQIVDINKRAERCVIINDSDAKT